MTGYIVPGPLRQGCSSGPAVANAYASGCGTELPDEEAGDLVVARPLELAVTTPPFESHDGLFLRRS